MLIIRLTKEESVADDYPRHEVCHVRKLELGAAVPNCEDVLEMEVQVTSTRRDSRLSE